MVSHRWEEALEKAEKDLLSNYVMAHHKAQAVEQEEDEREKGQQGEKREGGRQTGAPMPQKRSDKISEETKNPHTE
jgi:hypothetical protein